MKMTVSYAKLWKLLIDRRIKKADLKAAAEISPGTYAKLNRNQYVSMDVIGRICGVLSCEGEKDSDGYQMAERANEFV